MEILNEIEQSLNVLFTLQTTPQRVKDIQEMIDQIKSIRENNKNPTEEKKKLLNDFLADLKSVIETGQMLKKVTIMQEESEQRIQEIRNKEECEQIFRVETTRKNKQNDVQKVLQVLSESNSNLKAEVVGNVKAGRKALASSISKEKYPTQGHELVDETLINLQILYILLDNPDKKGIVVQRVKFLTDLKEFYTIMPEEKTEYIKEILEDTKEHIAILEAKKKKRDMNGYFGVRVEHDVKNYLS